MKSNGKELKKIFEQIKKKHKAESESEDSDKEEEYSSKPIKYYGGAQGLQKYLDMKYGNFYQGEGEVAGDKKKLFDPRKPLRSDGIWNEYEEYEGPYDYKWKQEEEKRLEALKSLPEYKFAISLASKTETKLFRVIEQQHSDTIQEKIDLEREQRRAMLKRTDISINELKSGLDTLNNEKTQLLTDQSNETEFLQQIQILFKAYKVYYEAWLAKEVTNILGALKNATNIEDYITEGISAILELKSHLNTENIAEYIRTTFTNLPVPYEEPWNDIYSRRKSYRKIDPDNISQSKYEYYGAFNQFFMYTYWNGYFNDYGFPSAYIKYYSTPDSQGLYLKRAFVPSDDYALDVFFNDFYSQDDSGAKYETLKLKEIINESEIGNEPGLIALEYQYQVIEDHLYKSIMNIKNEIERVKEARERVMTLYQNRLNRRVEEISIPENRFYLTHSQADSSINTGKVVFKENITGAINSVLVKIKHYYPKHAKDDFKYYLSNDTLMDLFASAVALSIHENQQLFSVTWKSQKQMKYNKMEEFNVYRKIGAYFEENEKKSYL